MFETASANGTQYNNASNGIQVILSVCDGPEMERPEVRARKIITRGSVEMSCDVTDVTPFLEQYVQDAWQHGEKIPWRRAYAIAHGNHQEALERRYGREGAEQFRRCVEYLAVGGQSAPESVTTDADATKIGFYRLGRRAKNEATKIGYAPAR